MEIEYFKNNILPLKEKLFRKALSITESTEDARDVTQDVMMRLWDKRREWNGISNIEVYSMVLVKNAALDKIRKKGRGHKQIDSGAAYDDHQTIPQERLEQEDDAALVWKIISLLPEKYGTLIKLRDIEELSYKEIAIETGMAEAQIKAALFKARQKMKGIYLKLTRNNDY